MPSKGHRSIGVWRGVSLGSPVTKLFMVYAVLLCACDSQSPPAEPPETGPAQQQAVVFDIDGTLTPKVHTIFRTRDGAAEIVGLMAKKGYRIVYLSARVKVLSAGIPAWLKENGFPDGRIFIAESGEEHRHPATFKAGVLKTLIEQGWALAYAYGDSSTDFEAYAAAGIPKDRVFALLREGEKTCQPGEWSACLAGWTGHVNFVRQSVPPVPAG